MTFPLIYCNGCSYSDQNYQSPTMLDKTYSHYLAQELNGYTINNAKSGSCNRRIIRSSTHDLLLERKHNPDQQIIALIQLSFEIRDELWDNTVSLNSETSAAESNFKTHQFSNKVNWRELLLAGADIMKDITNIQSDKKFLTKWSEGRAFFYSPYAERINLLLDLLFFTNLLKSQGIDYLIFAGPMFEKLENEYLVDFFKTQLQDARIFDLENFGFCNWCGENGYVPIDPSEPTAIGHYGPDAHRAFATQLVLPRLNELGIVS